MSLFHKLNKQRLEGLRDGFDDMWGVVMHPQTYYDLIGECYNDQIALRVDSEADYIFGLRIIPSWGQDAGEFTIVDELLGRQIIGKEVTFKI